MMEGRTLTKEVRYVSDMRMLTMQEMRRTDRERGLQGLRQGFREVHLQVKSYSRVP